MFYTVSLAFLLHCTDKDPWTQMSNSTPSINVVSRQLRNEGKRKTLLMQDLAGSLFFNLLTTPALPGLASYGNLFIIYLMQLCYDELYNLCVLTMKTQNFHAYVQLQLGYENLFQSIHLSLQTQSANFISSITDEYRLGNFINTLKSFLSFIL